MNASSEKNKEQANKPANDNSQGLLRDQFVRSFIKFQNESDIASFISALDAGGKGKISPEVREEMRLYHNASRSLYPDLDINTITQRDFIKKLAPEITKISNMKSLLRSQIQNLYDINDENFDTQILPSIKELKYLDLKGLIQGKENLEQFVDSLEYYTIPANKEKKPQKRDIKTFLESFGLQQKWKTLSKEKQMRLYSIQQTITETPSAVTSEDIGEILEIANLSGEEKKSLMQYYFPVVSVGTLRKYDIITEKKARELTKKFVNMGAKDLGLSTTQLDKIGNDTDYDDVIVSTKDFSPKEVEALTKSDAFQTGLVRETKAIGKQFQEKLTESLPKDIGEFQRKLSQAGVTGAENFKNGSIIITKVNSGGISKLSFSEIKSDSSMTGQIQVIDRGVEEFTSGNGPVSKGLTQEEFITQFTKTGSENERLISKMEVVRADDFQELLKNGTYIQHQDGLRLKSEQDLYNQYEERKKVLGEQGKTKEEIESDEELRSIKDFNENQVAEKLDETDDKGKGFGFKKGVTFELTNPQGYWTILGTSNQIVELQSVSGMVQKVSYEAFVEGFEKMKGKRVSEVSSVSALLESISKNDKISNAWKDIKWSNDGLQRSEESDDGHGKKKSSTIEFPYLVSGSGGTEYIKILSLSDGGAEIQFGTVESTTSKGKNGKEQKGEKYSLEPKEYKVTLGFLEAWIKKYSLEPKTLTDKDTAVQDKDSPHDHREWSFVNWYFSNLSLHTMMTGFHDIQHSIEHKLEAGTKEQASQFAYKAFSLLPYKQIELLDELRSGLKSDTEMAQKKRMDEAIEHLGGVDTPDAIDEICHWLHYTNTPDYKIHAAMMYMIQKYGVLCAKNGANKSLIDQKGDFIWYKALGGKVNDAFFKQIQKECEQEEGGKGVPFSEEELVYKWLKELARKGKIRSRLHKEFKKSRSEGKESEYGTGNKDAGDERGAQGRLKFTMGELYTGNYPNALGGLEMLYKKGAGSVDLEQVPFIMAFSGIAYDFDGKVISDKMKNFPSNGWLSPILKFMSYPSQIDTINQTILAVAKRIADLENNQAIYTEALEIFQHQKSHADLKNWNYRKKIEKTEKYYKKYGKKIIPALFMAHDGKYEGENDRYNGLIKVEQDDGVHFDGKESKGNLAFKEYTKNMEGFTSEFKFDAEGIFDDMQRGNGISGLDLYRIGSKKLSFTQGGKIYGDSESTVQLIEEIKSELAAIPQRSYTSTGLKSRENKTIQKKVAKKIIREIFGAISHNHGTNVSILGYLNAPTGTMSFLNKYGINFMDLKKFEANEFAVMDGSNSQFEKKLDEIADNIISNNGLKKGSGNQDFSLVQGVIDSTKVGVNKNSKSRAQNDNDPEVNPFGE